MHHKDLYGRGFVASVQAEYFPAEMRESEEYLISGSICQAKYKDSKQKLFRRVYAFRDLEWSI